VDIIGLNPMKSLITPLDAVPALFAGKKIYQGGRLGIQGAQHLYVSGRSLQALKFGPGLSGAAKAGLGLSAVGYGGQGIKLIGQSAKPLAIGTSILGVKYIGDKKLRSYYQSRDRSKSYQQTERLGTTTTRIPAAKPSRSENKTSRRTAYSGDARRRTTYCKRHAQYDFCEKYNIRK
jgi:hypothetical protein